MYKFLVLSLTLSFAVVTHAATGEPVTYTVNGNHYEGYYLSPSANAPLVLLIHDWDGLTDYEVKRAHMLADLGYAVFAVDMFGAGIRPTEVVDKKQHTGELYTDRKKMRALISAALDTAKSKGANTNNAIAAGYCFGGAVVLEAARNESSLGEYDLKGFATFHGGLQTPDGQSYAATDASIIVFHGSADSAIPMSQFADLTNELEKAGIKHEMISYGGAPHAFTVFGGERYREDADKKSWARFTEYLEATLK